MTITAYDLCGPDPVPMECDEVTAIKELVRMLPRNPIIVNIGAERGISTVAMLEERPDAYIYSVDIGACAGEFVNLQNAGLDITRVQRVLGRSQEVDTSEFSEIDMIFVDGDHSHDGVRDDIDNWFHLLKPGAIASFHDYIPEPIPPHIRGRAAYAIDEWIASLQPDQYDLVKRERRLIAFQVRL